MKIALIGASGFIGSALLNEAISRSHVITALVGRPERVAPHERVLAQQANVLETLTLSAQIEGHDAVISAFSGHADSDIRGYYMRGLRSIVAAVITARVPRFLMVGGAGSLETSPGLQLVDSPDFPAQWKESALAARDALEFMRAQSDLDWTMLSPSALIRPGSRTGQFRVGGDALLRSVNGESEISLEDYAIAMIDELENPEHSKRRFTVGY